MRRAASSAGLLLLVARALGQSCPKLPAVPGVAAMASSFPPQGQIARIVAGDTEARRLYEAMTGNATYRAALAIAPVPLRAGAPVLAGVPADACDWSATNCVTPRVPYLQTDVHDCREPGVYGLSVDDGPNDAHCNLLKLYADENIRASFFYIGSNMFAFPQAAQNAHNAGHTLCVHTWSHNYMTSLTNEQAFAELYYTKLAIKKVVGVTPRCWRPAFGDLDNRIRTIAYALELGPAWIWDADTDDWQIDEPAGAPIAAKSYDEVIASVSKTTGHLVLNHESSEKIVGLFLQHYPTIKRTFSHVLGGHVCNNLTRPYPEDLTYPDYTQYLAGQRADTMQTLKAVADPNAQIVWAGLDAPQTGGGGGGAAATPSTPAGNGTATRPGNGNATVLGPSRAPVVVVVAANGTVIGTQLADSPQSTIAVKPGSATRTRTGPLAFALAALALTL